jgi:superfamily II DNA or RNA helicase
MSATPEREYDEWMEEHVEPLLGGMIFRYGYEDARRDGVISAFDLYNVEVPLRPGEAKKYDQSTRAVARLLRRLRAGEDVEGKLKIALRQRASIGSLAALRIPVAVKVIDSHNGKRAIVFHERISAADELRDILSSRGHRTTVYHSGIDPPVRRDNLRLYRQGAFDILVTCRALDEGVNVPETELAVIASSTASVRQRIQRLGRVLRPALGKDRATIYTLYATPVEQQRLEREAANGSGADSVQWLRTSVGIGDV